MLMPDSPLPGRVQGVKDSDVLEEARKRYKLATDASAENRNRYREQIRFVGGEQWDALLKQAREGQRRPCLVMDRLGTHINQVVNDQRQSKPAIKCHPVDDKADVEVAKVLNGVIRNIEHQSNAPAVYETATFTQVAGGLGYWRVLTKYLDEEAFEQDICLSRIQDPLSVTFDPNAKEQDGSDARYCFVETVVSRDQFVEDYPSKKGECESWPSADPLGWWTVDTVRCAEYFRIVQKPATLFLLADGSVMDAVDFANSERDPSEVIDQRQTRKPQVQWFKLGGNSVIDSRIFPGKYIPVVRVVGNEMVIDGKTIYTGLTWRAMDAQRLYNYQSSVIVEMLSLQKTAPYIGAKGQFKGVEKQWATANVNNPAYLEYEPVDINGTLAPAPQRQPTPQVPTGNVQALELAAMDLQWITGQHAANFGAKSNETSGRAIRARQEEGDTATYHYLDNLSRSILHTGRILVDLIPKIYDKRRILRILGEDDTAEVIEQDPDQPDAMVRVQTPEGIRRIYNLGVGRYDVAVSVGPSFGTKRQESVEAMTELLRGNPELWQAIGDLYLRNQDWPGAQEMADRLKKMVPPQLQAAEGDQSGPEMQIAQMQEALQAADMMMQERDAQLQQAAQQVQQLQQALEQSQSEAFRQQTDVQAKTEAEAIKAQAQVRVAELQAEIEAAKAAQAMAQAERDDVRQIVQQLAQDLEAMRSEKDESPDEEDAMLTQIAQSQQQLAQMVQQLSHIYAASRTAQIQIARGPNGQISGAQIVNNDGSVRSINFSRGPDGISGAAVE